MKRLKKVMALGMTAAMVAGMSATVFAAGGPPGPVDGLTLTNAGDFSYDGGLTADVHSYSGGVQITDVQYTSLYANSNSISSERVSLISSIDVIDIATGTPETIAVDTANKTAVLVVNGVQQDLLPGTYEGAATITLIQKSQVEFGFSKFDGLFTGGGFDNIYYYHTAGAVIANNELQEGYSATDAISGTVGDTQSTDVSVNSQGSFFSGFYLVNTNYTIDRLTMTLNGRGGDDFQGWGAGIVVKDNANLNLSNTYINTTGAVRTGIWVGGSNSVLNADNVVVEAHNDDTLTEYTRDDDYSVPMLERVPLVLGLNGNIRATNVLGSGTANYTNSLIVSDVWGALSTDSGDEGTTALNVSNTLSGIGYIEEAQDGKTYTATKTVNGKTYGFTIGKLGVDSGYVAYADAGVRDNFTNVSFYAPDYIGIIASKTSSMYFTDSYGYSDRIGFLIHQNNSTADTTGGLHISGGTFDVADSFVVVRGGAMGDPAAYTYTNIEVDGADVNLFGNNAQSGVLLQLTQNDDAGGPGAKTYTIDDMTYDEIKAYAPEEGITTVEPTTATFKNMTVKGDIYNSIAMAEQDLNVTLENVTIDGAISSSYAYHVDANGNQMNDVTIGEDDYLAFNRLVNVPAQSVRNDVNLTLKNTTWNVTKVSYVNSITMDSSSKVNGTIEKLSDGTYKVSPKAATSPKTGEASSACLVLLAAMAVMGCSTVIRRRRVF